MYPWPITYFIVAAYGGCHLYRQLYYAEMLAFRPTADYVRRQCPISGDYATWQLFVLFAVNPIVAIHDAKIFNWLDTFLYCCALLLYMFVFYVIAPGLLCELSDWVWQTSKLYNRGSIFRHSYYFLRIYVRDVFEGSRPMPHMLHSYLLLCFLWSSFAAVLSGSCQLWSIFIRVARLFLRGRHYGVLCRAVSMWTVVIGVAMSGIPTPILYLALCMEAIYPTLVDDECYIVSDTTTEPMHPGYIGTMKRLDAPMSMSPDGLCLYHCIACAMDYVSYMAGTPSDRVALAEKLRASTISELRQHGLDQRADRLQLSGTDGYPDEEDFKYIAMASGLSSEPGRIATVLCISWCRRSLDS